ncbi:MAG: hypothetical protein ABWZ99_07430 [Ilumatobacteraceae bacterium]
MSRRDLLRASAGAAAVAVPMSALGSQVAGATAAAEHGAGSTDTARGASTGAEADLVGPVIFSVLDARRGEVSILHGTSEVIVRDRQLVERIVHAARRAV